MVGGFKKCSPCLEYLDKHPCFVSVGEIGLERPPERLRFYEFLFCGALIAASAILLCVSAIGLSLDSTDDVPWAQASSSGVIDGMDAAEFAANYVYYAGPAGTVTTWRVINKTDFKAVLNEVVPIAWADEDCILKSCGECHSASQISIPFLFAAIALSLPVLMCTCQRATEESDNNVEKMVGVVGGFLSFACTLTAFIVYYTQCATRLPTTAMYAIQLGYELPVTVHYDWELGIGQICLIVAAACQFLAVANHIAVQVKVEEEEEKSEEQILIEKTRELRKAHKKTLQELQKCREEEKATSDRLITIDQKVKDATMDAYRAHKHFEESERKAEERVNKFNAAHALEASILQPENLINEANATKASSSSSSSEEEGLPVSGKVGGKDGFGPPGTSG